MSSHDRDVVVVDGRSCPGIPGVLRVAGGARVSLDHSVLGRLDEARRVYLDEAGRRRVYGYCTGLGARLDEEGACGPAGELAVLRAHAAGAGAPAPAGWVRAFLFVRLLQLSRGSAPVRGVVAERLAEALNAGVTPRVPLWGSVGASGDLAPSAHAMLCVVAGEGVTLDGRPCRRALEEAGLEPLSLETGEALALINNTAWSTAVAMLGVARIRRALGASLEVASWTARAAGAPEEHFSPEALAAKGHKGVLEAAEALAYPGPAPRAPRKLQAPYSVRCVPQVYGAALEALEWASRLLEEEACGAPENPTVAGGSVYHTCNFHASYTALAADTAAIAAATIASMIERRVDRLMDSKTTGLPDFLAGPGSSVGLMILQYTAASLAAEARAEAQPRSIHLIPTSLSQEDHPSMAPAAAYRLHKLADILEILVAIEATVASKALEAQGEEPPLALQAPTPSQMIEQARRALFKQEDPARQYPSQ